MLGQDDVIGKSVPYLGGPLLNESLLISLVFVGFDHHTNSEGACAHLLQRFTVIAIHELFALCAVG